MHVDQVSGVRCQVNVNSSVLNGPYVLLLLPLLSLLLTESPLLLHLDPTLESAFTCTTFPSLYEGWSEDSIGKRRRRDWNAPMSPTEMDETL
jgi:hypothetical protein